MPQVQVVDMAGQKVGDIELSDAIFGVKPNKTLMHEMVVNYLANKRQGTQSALTRAEVSGGGRKPWRQKGTGRARQGSIRAPQWRHGGIVFAPKPRDYSFTVNKKEKRLALKSAFSSKLLDNSIIVLDALNLDTYKTKDVANMLKAVGAGPKPLIVLPNVDGKAINSTRNIPGAKTAQVNNLNVYDILNCTNLILIKESVNKIEEVYA
ncbi:MAG: 50S ribosomal protein L4 [Eubacteriales bacterium SKADARSKE-1]|nr:50S ribosomal protein L4 [Eubacteriales bacterium SKADARSKE-1]